MHTRSILAIAALALAACGDARPLSSGLPKDITCNHCHGSESNAAPPYGTRGETDTATLAVGAHQAHLTGGRVAAAVACQACHLVPASVDDGHADGLPAELTFGDLARARGATPAWNREAATCATYCHGATLKGGKHTAPVWTKVDGSQLACDGCHGNPPPAPHPASAACASCHPATVNAQGAIDLSGGRHIDGNLDLAGFTCTSCHGTEGVNAAPPKDTRGETATSSAAVGAHQKHLGASDWHRAGECSDCHAVPTENTHGDGAVQLSFGAAARADGATPTFESGAHTCSATYCHGATLAGAQAGAQVRRTPVWNQVDGTFAACGASCHTNPPGGTHPALSDCATCHGAVVGASGAFVDASRHIDGTVDVAGSACNSCHGGPDNAAPPSSTTGATQPSDVAVGAHQSHVRAGALRAALACSECHVVPSTLGAAGHLDAAPAEVQFGTLSSLGAASPAWDRAAATCASTYCHGATLAGGSLKTPVWTATDGAATACGACHGFPPPAPHPTSNNCSQCHAETVNASGAILVSGGKHIDGTVQGQRIHPDGWSDPQSPAFHGPDGNRQLTMCKACHGADLGGGSVGISCTSCHGANWTSNCTFCHGGTDNQTGAPPEAVDGTAATSAVTVGAHTAHLAASRALSVALDCTACHIKPADALAAGHLDASPAEMTWGTLAKTGNPSPSWTRASGTCASNYCHGATLQGGTATSPVWTTVDGTQVRCDSCHGFPPPTGQHLEHTGSYCYRCHQSVVVQKGATGDPPPEDVASGQILAAGRSLHVNGAVDVSIFRVPSANGDPTYDFATGNCANTCHGSAVMDWKP